MKKVFLIVLILMMSYNKVNALTLNEDLSYTTTRGYYDGMKGVKSDLMSGMNY